jgi:Ni,Fe-hydrogenase I cytochrome b subunit
MESYITNFLIIVVFILTSLLIFKDLYDSDVIANFNFTNFINEKNNTNINKVIETIIDDRVSEL